MPGSALAYASYFLTTNTIMHLYTIEEGNGDIITVYATNEDEAMALA